MVWDYDTKLRHLLSHSMIYEGTLSVACLPTALQGKELSFHVLTVQYYNEESEQEGESGRFEWSDINDLFSTTSKRNLDLVDESLEGFIQTSTSGCCRKLWGFSLTKTSKIWIPDYEPRRITL